MESPSAEFRTNTTGALGGGADVKLDLEQQFKSMRELLKVYGLSASEENKNPQKGECEYKKNNSKEKEVISVQNQIL